jgi:hypothetical protein
MKERNILATEKDADSDSEDLEELFDWVADDIAQQKQPSQFDS